MISDQAFTNQPGIAAFLPRRGGGHDVLALEAGAPAKWVVYNQAAQRLSDEIATSRFFTVDRRNILASVSSGAAVGGTAPSGGLVLAGPPEELGAPWRKAVVYASPDAVLADRGFEESAGSAVAALSGSVVAVLTTPTGVTVREICGPPGATMTRPLANDISGYIDMIIEGGSAAAVVTAVNRWGLIQQFLVSGIDRPGSSPLRACDASPLRVEALSEATARPELVAARFVAQTAGANDPDYTVIGLEGATGPVMIRPYGSFGLPVQNYAIGEFERRWLESGGRLIVPVLRGDAARAAGPHSGRGDYKEAATADLLAVVDDAGRRGIGRPGEYVVAGYSAGAYVAARAALTRPTLFRAALLFSGALDLGVLAGTTTDVAEFGPAAGGFPLWFSGIPAPERAPRFLLWHAENDDRAPVAASRNFARYLSSLGYKGELTISDRGGHDAGLRSATADRAMEFVAAIGQP